MKLPHIASRIFNTPLLIHPSKLDAIIYGLSGRLGVDIDRPAHGLYTTSKGEWKEPGYRVIDKVAVVDVFGVLAHRGRIEADSSYVLGYQEIARRLDSAQRDASVEAVVLQFDSPGGEAAGVDDMADQIRELAAVKPVHASISNHAHSAAMWLASAADSISITRTGWAGSVGVVMRHVDMSRALDSDGIKVTHIFAGAHKIDGNPFEPLPESVRDEWQKEIDGLYSMFVSAVAQNRKISEQQIRDTEARSFMGLEAVAAGLADRIETPDRLIDRLNREISTGSITRGRIVTSTHQEKAEMSNHATGDRPDNEAESTDNVDVASIKAEARTAERGRIGAILNHEAAIGRESLAKSLALDTDMTADQAGKVLASAAMDLKHAATNPLHEAMKAVGTPGIGGEMATDEAENDAAAMAASILKFKS